MSASELQAYLLSFSDSELGYPFGPELQVYTLQGEMYALASVGKEPLQLSLRCDPRLARLLRQRYVEVMPGRNLNQKYWNTIVLSGQLTDDEVKDLIRHSVELVKQLAV